MSKFRTNVVHPVPPLVEGMTGFRSFSITSRHVYAYNGCGQLIGRVTKGRVPKDFGPMMKGGAFGMVDAFRAAMRAQQAQALANTERA